MSSSALMPVEEAIAKLLAMAEAQHLHDSEPVPLNAARQRVLANDLVATLDLPPWPNSAMDGYALSVHDWNGQPLAVSQQVFAGRKARKIARARFCWLRAHGWDRSNWRWLRLRD